MKKVLTDLFLCYNTSSAFFSGGADVRLPVLSDPRGGRREILDQREVTNVGKRQF